VEARHHLDAAGGAQPPERRERTDGLVSQEELARLTGGMPDELAALIEVQLPRPGDGDTWSRFEFLRDLGRSDLSLARLVEGHLDATSVLAEFGAPVPRGFGAVWAARPEELEIAPISGGWALWGSKPYCGGAPWCSWALVLGHEPGGGSRLVRLRPCELANFDPASWPSTGLARTYSYTARFVGVVDGDAAVGPSGGFEQRAGFWHAAVGLATCGLGTAHGLLEDVEAAGGRARGAEGRLGLALARVAAADALVERAAQEIDHEPFDDRSARRRALLVRSAVADAVTTARTTAASLASPDQWSRESSWARRIADVDVFLSHHHASEDDVLVALERDS
jgi:alkylation response protein AidB-like acyl-CoA dehydrogenase